MKLPRAISEPTRLIGGRKTCKLYSSASIGMSRTFFIVNRLQSELQRPERYKNLRRFQGYWRPNVQTLPQGYHQTNFQVRDLGCTVQSQLLEKWNQSRPAVKSVTRSRMSRTLSHVMHFHVPGTTAAEIEIEKAPLRVSGRLTWRIDELHGVILVSATSCDRKTYINSFDFESEFVFRT